MSETSLRLEVTTPKGQALALDVQSVQAMSVKGEFGVLPGHLPVLVALRCGLLTYQVGSEKHHAVMAHGFAEAEFDRVNVLTHRFATAEDVQHISDADVKAAEAELAQRDPVEERSRYEDARRELEWRQACRELIELSKRH